MPGTASATIGRFLAAAALALGAAAVASRAQCLEGCTAIHTLVGEAAGDQFGWEARLLGDVNADGVADFVVSAPTNDGGGVDAGRVYVYSGATGAELYRLTGAIANAQFGTTSNPAGDSTGDGAQELAVGSPCAARGRVTLHSGASGTELRAWGGEAVGDQFGFRVAGGGDLDLDGVPDLLVSAPRNDAFGVDAGRVYALSAVTGGVICSVDGESANDLFGTALAFAGDLDGDGRDEFVVGAQDAGAGAAGRAYICSFNGLNCTRIRTMSPSGLAFEFGQFFVDGREDLDRDGVPDYYVADFNVNKAYLYSGADGSLYTILGGDGNGGFGIGELIPDIDNDGHADAILAAWISNAGGFQAGKVFVYSGRTAEVLETLTHDIPGATFGFDAAGMGDLNGDGREDYLISAAWDAAQRGTTYVIAGKVRPFLDADFDFNECVDFFDAELLMGEIGCAASCLTDADDDGDSDMSDAALLQASFGACRG